MEDWVRVYRGTELFKAKMVESILFNHGITSETVNKQDSMYIMFGQIDIYVHHSQSEEAIKILKTLDNTLDYE